MHRVLIADSCIGGLSVLRALPLIDDNRQIIFLADYAINPLGTKSDAEIKLVVDRWLRAGEAHADELLIACNTLSVRYAQLLGTVTTNSKPLPVTSMVDYFESLIDRESDVLFGANVLIVGTQFTSSQPLFSELLRERGACANVETFAATQLERQIARFEDGDVLADRGFADALARCDVAILACTCFPFAIDALHECFPTKVFLNPAGNYEKQSTHVSPKPIVSIATTGALVSPARVLGFAKLWLGDRFDVRPVKIAGLD